MNRREFIGGAALCAVAGRVRAGEVPVASGGFVYSRTLPTKVDIDVFVAGGGPAGVAAAVTAARKGAKVFVAEAHTCFGGMSTAGRIPLFMQHSDGVRDMDVGFGQEVRARLARERHLQGPATDIEALKRVYYELIVSSGADFLFQSRVLEYERYLRNYLKRGFENARVVPTADLMGVRASRRIVGDYILTKEDFARRATFPDEIGRYCYRIDVHSKSLDAKSVA